MPYRLKSIELNGYKTFANKSEFEFAENITAIVGPNGSGKSNIADALRWVLGEQSYSLLRGRKTDDMIFAGSDTRPRAGMASATLIFDNADGWLPIDFSEVSVTRRAYRDGQNEYLINNQKVRLRDVNELLSQSGLSERTYTVIGQGLVDVALSLNAAERRRLFEEAAGIGLYRTRKDQSVRRLEKTKRNIERVEDILSELKPRLRSLKSQARRAEEYTLIKQDLQEVLREWYGYHWHSAQKELKNAREMGQHQSSILDKTRQDQEVVSNNLEKTRGQINELRARLATWHKNLAGLHTQREEINRNLAVGEERQRSISDMESALQRETGLIEVEKNLNQQRLIESKEEAERISKLVIESEEQVASSKSSLDERLSERTLIDEEINSMRNQLVAHGTQRIDREAQRLSAESRINSLRTENDTLESKINQSKEELGRVDSLLAKGSNEVAEAKKNVVDLETQIEQETAKVNTFESDRTEQFSKLNAEEAESARLHAQIDVIDQAERNLTGYASGVQLLLNAAQEKRISSNDGALSKHLEIPPELDVAIAAAIGEYADAVLLEGSADAEKALDLLQAKEGRAALLPLGKLSALAPLKGIDDPDCLGIASELVSIPKKFKGAVDLLLGQVLVVKDRRAAERLLKDQDANVKAVTLTGELFHNSGAIYVDSKGGSGVLARPRQKKELEESLAANEKQIAKIKKYVEKLEQNIGSGQSEKSTLSVEIVASTQNLKEVENSHQEQLINKQRIVDQIEWQKSKLTSQSDEIEKLINSLESIQSGKEGGQENIIELERLIKEKSLSLNELPREERQKQVSHWETQLAVNKQSHEEAIKRQVERQSFLDGVLEQEEEIKRRVGEKEGKKEALVKSMHESRGSEGDLGTEILTLQALISPAEEELTEIELENEKLIAEERKERESLNMAERHNAQAQIALGRKQESLEVLRGKIEDDFGLVEFVYDDAVSGPTPLPLGDLVQRLPLVEELSPDIDESLKRQRAQLRRMGSINPEAQIEFEQVQERHDFLSTQLEDLAVAEKDVREVIVELDNLMEREFRKTFDNVAAEFRQIFSRLFGGGSAKLILTEGETFADTGVDIDTRLPGKRAQRLALLSGGERSLTATALVFALLKASPTPFCVMDEVDAMLDEANIGRFTELLLEFSKETQFILITHNRNTIQAADVIYGITMGRDTASQVISLNLEEVDDHYTVGSPETVN